MRGFSFLLPLSMCAPSPVSNAGVLGSELRGVPAAGGAAVRQEEIAVLAVELRHGRDLGPQPRRGPKGRIYKTHHQSNV